LNKTDTNTDNFMKQGISELSGEEVISSKLLVNEPSS